MKRASASFFSSLLGIRTFLLLRRRRRLSAAAAPLSFLRRSSFPHMVSSSSSSSSSMAKVAEEAAEGRYSYNPELRWNTQVEAYFAHAYGAEHFARISKALTRPSCYSCIRVNTLKSSVDAVVEKLKNILDGNDMCNGIEANQVNNQERVSNCNSTSGEAETPIQFLGSSPISKCQYPGLDNVVLVRGSGPHILCYDLTGEPMKEVIVSRKCAEAVLRGAQVYVPGVLACSSHVEKGDKVAVSVAIEQPVEYGGWSVDPLYRERSGLYIGQGVTSMSRAGIFRASEGVGVEMEDRVYKLPSFNDVLEGEIFLQNLPSIITARVLDPQQGERILDMCAAPGGKTTAIAILMRDKGEVVAIDRSHNKVMEILKLAAEMDLHCIKAYKLDALKSVRRTNEETDVEATVTEDDKSYKPAVGDQVSNTEKCCPNSKIEQNDRKLLSKADLMKNARKMKNGPGRNNSMGGRVEKSKGFMPNSFDRVLLDAPCSALGLRPRLFAGEETLESLRNHAKYQRRMFDQAIQLVRAGGVIVYSTCTINPGENEALVRYALDTYKFLSLASQQPKIGGPGIVGHCELFKETYVEGWLTKSEAELVQRFDPSSSIDTIGFFIAKFDDNEFHSLTKLFIATGNDQKSIAGAHYRGGTSFIFPRTSFFFSFFLRG
ncbi:putative methyltransferase NSUN6 [Ananas comosus]|uniref:Putative methyltransferase NSUN6 n=1 Tax=Ananas comosus TaxID=4615 RepID=A0A199W6N6_ANACO|nr:putative methyltransferase NSUN6 [Ananas comosus]